jgi:predicted TIM-barrel fold metal-dependent hydrolase
MNAHRIDVHHHYFPPEYLAALEHPERLPDVVRAWTPERSIDDMDRAGVAQALLSITTPGVWFGDAEAARRVARSCNEYAVRLAQRYPGRFGVFAALPLPDIDGALAEIAYALDVLGASGVGMFTSYGKAYLGDPLFVPIFEELNRRKAVVYTHPTLNECCANLVPEIGPTIIEYGTDTTRAIASLLFSGAAARYRDIRLIFSHAGGTMPFLIERFLNLAREARWATRLPDGVLAELQRFYYDTAQVSNRSAMSSLREVIPASQILFGTDYPYRGSEEHVNGLKTCGFDAGELEAIESSNARRLLGLLHHDSHFC